MAKSAKTEAILADASLAQSQKTAPALKKMMEQHQHHGHAEQSIREDEYKGHHIVIKTTYEVTVDGKPFRTKLGVSNAGNVQYHGIPNVGFASAVELMRCVIDQFPAEFPKAKAKKKPAPKKPVPPTGGHDHGTHDHATHDHGEAAKPRAKKGGR